MVKKLRLNGEIGLKSFRIDARGSNGNAKAANEGV
jgi:hypothetical protein